MSTPVTQVARPSEPQNSEADDEFPELLELLGDEYTRRVLQAVVEEPRSGTAVMEAADVSKATAYRRLGTLEDAGLIESRTVFDPNGHHHEQFHAVVESVDIEFGSEGLSVHIETESEPETLSPPRRVGRPAADD